MCSSILGYNRIHCNSLFTNYYYIIITVITGRKKPTAIHIQLRGKFWQILSSRWWISVYVAGVEHFAGQREHTMDVASFLKELTIAREYFASKFCFWKCLRNSSDVMAIIMTFVLYIDSRQTNPTMYHCIPVASLCILNKE